MRVQPLDDRVLVEPIDSLPETPEGMLMLPSGVIMNRAVAPGEEECQRALVVAVGPGELVQGHTGWVRKPAGFKVDDEVLIAKYATLDMNNNLNVRMPGREVTLDGKKLRMIDYNEVLAVFAKEVDSDGRILPKGGTATAPPRSERKKVTA